MTSNFADQLRFLNRLGLAASKIFVPLVPLCCLAIVLMLFLAPGLAFSQDVQVPTDSAGGDVGGGTQIARWRLPLKVTVSVSGGYDDNPNGESSGSNGSALVGANIGLTYDFGTLRTRGSLRTGTGFTYFPDLSTNRYDPNLFLNLTLTHQVSLRMTLDATVSVSYQSEPDFSNTLTLDRRAGNYFGTVDSLSLSFQWLPRLSTVTAYTFGTTLYNDRSVADNHDHVDQTFSESIRFLYLPITTLVATYSLSGSLYNGDTDRNSFVHAFLLGFDHTLSEKLQGLLRGGFEVRSTNGSSLQSNDGLNPHFEAGLTYAVTGKTSLSWNASYATRESQVPLSSASLTLATGLVASYAVTPRITTNFSCFYQHSDNGTVEFFPGFVVPYTQDSIDVSLGVNYAINRFLSANASYSHTEISSDLPDRSYSRNSFSGGLSFNF